MGGASKTIASRKRIKPQLETAKMKSIITQLGVACLAIGTVSAQRDAAKVVPNEHRSIKNEIERAISRGIDFLKSQQQENGSWGDEAGERWARGLFRARHLTRFRDVLDGLSNTIAAGENGGVPRRR